MAFPQKLLTEDEEVIEHLQPHWITLVAPVLVFLMVCVLIGFGVAYAPDGNHLEHEVSLLGVGLVALVLIGRYSVAPVLAWRCTHYVFTTRRVLIRRGVLRHTGRDIPLTRINDVSYEQSLLDRMLGAGSVTIESAGENGSERLENLPRADEVQQTLNRLVERYTAR